MDPAVAGVEKTAGARWRPGEGIGAGGSEHYKSPQDQGQPSVNPGYSHAWHLHVGI
jgi:hypothetical protein